MRSTRSRFTSSASDSSSVNDPCLPGDRDLLMQVLQRVLAHVLARAVADHQQLRRGNQAAADPRHQRLRQHAGQRHRQLLPHRVLPLDRKRVGDPRHRGRDVAGVQAREHQVSGLARGDRDLHRLRIAHLADHDDVGRLAERGAQRGREVGRVDADLDLLDDRPAVRVLVLDRILDGDDVARVAQVDLVDQRRERGGLAGAGRAADQDQAARQPRQRFDRRRQVERGEARDGGRQAADRRGGAAALVVQVDAEAPEVGGAERSVGDAALAIELARVRRQRRRDGVLDFLAAERRLGQRHDLAVDAQRRRRAGHEQQIARRSRRHLAEPRAQPRGLLVGAARFRRAGVELGDQRVEIAVVASSRRPVSP